MNPEIVEHQIKTTNVLRRERLDFMRDRFGHNDPPFNPQFGRITYLAHAKGFVMARRPGCRPFAISEARWRSFTFWDAKVHSR